MNASSPSAVPWNASILALRPLVTRAGFESWIRTCDRPVPILPSCLHTMCITIYYKAIKASKKHRKNKHINARKCKSHHKKYA